MSHAWNACGFHDPRGFKSHILRKHQPVFSTENAGCFCFLGFPRTFSPPRTHEHENRRTGFSRRTAVLGFSCSRVRGDGYKQASPDRTHTAALPRPSYTLEMTNFSAVEMLRDPIFDTVITHEFAVDDVVEAFDTAADSQVSGKVVVAL